MTRKVRFVKAGIIFSLFLSPLFLVAEDTGVNFVHGLSWEQVKAKAKAENKYIFVDCFATWCGPCKYMNEKIFSKKEIGEFINSKFISVAIQFDQTPEDRKEIKDWYKDAKKFEREFSINSFPTYLFFSPDGHVVHRITGSTKDDSLFISQVNDALKPEKQYYSLVEQYKYHKKDSSFLRDLLILSINFGDKMKASKIGNFYFDCLKNPFLKENLEIIIQTVESTKDKGFKFLLENQSKVTCIEKNAEIVVCNIIYSEYLERYFKADGPVANWKKILRVLKNKFPAVADKMVSQAKPNYYIIKKQWPEFEDALLTYMKNYQYQMSPFEKNNNAWNAFSFSKNAKVLKEAIKWSEGLIKEENFSDPNHIDTYANLLYKVGDVNQAIGWEKKAIQLAAYNNNIRQSTSFKDNLRKMERGENTWN